MYCPNCGKEIADGVKFCPECGKNVNAGNKPQKSKTLLCAIVALCLVLGLGGYWLHVEIDRARGEAIEESKGIEPYADKREKERKQQSRSLGTIDLNYELPEPGSSQSE